MKKVLVICGQTATGKTNLGFYLAEKFNGEIISADSRQVYREMDIGTGKDIPNSKIPIWGIDIVNPDEEFSVSHFRKYALQKVIQIVSRGKLPIIVGGTGFYIDAIFKKQNLIDIPRDNNLREKLSVMSSDQLLDILHKLDPNVADSMNESDIRNKVRLIRKIEIAKNPTSASDSEFNHDFDLLWIGLKLDKEKLKKRIEDRVEKRVNQGFENEFNKLKEKYSERDVFNKTPGYKDWPDKSAWAKSELDYAKRQLTWFKKNEDIHWFEADIDRLDSSVEEIVRKWYPKSIK